MVADASDEALAFVRFLDDESCDKSSLAHVIEVFHFLTNITRLSNLELPSSTAIGIINGRYPHGPRSRLVDFQAWCPESQSGYYAGAELRILSTPPVL